MKLTSFLLIYLFAFALFIGCSKNIQGLEKSNVEIVNRNLTALHDNTLELDAKRGDGLAILKHIKFKKGIIELDIKGENNPGRSFVGLAFNIQNDSTYEAVYFRPFNFRSKEEIQKKHAVQYIFHPKNTWRFLRTNFEGKYESEFPRQPDPDDWFTVQIKIDDTTVTVFDKETQTSLLSIQRLTLQTSNRIAFWTGFNSKGSFRNLRIIK